MKTFETFLTEAIFNNWVIPSDDDLKLEWKLEYDNKNLDKLIGRNVWPTPADFVRAVHGTGEITKVNSSLDNRIGYRSHTRSKEELISLLKSYRSWPQYRNEKTVDRMYNGFTKGDKMPMPIVLNINGRLRILGGNTRADVAMQLFGNYKAIFIKVPLD